MLYAVIDDRPANADACLNVLVKCATFKRHCVIDQIPPRLRHGQLSASVVRDEIQSAVTIGHIGVANDVPRVLHGAGLRPADLVTVA